MTMVNIQVQAIAGMWTTVSQVESNNSIGIRYRLDEAQKTYKTRCRAQDQRTGTIVDYRG